MNTFAVNALPTAGSLFGTIANTDLLQSINAGLNNNAFFNSIDDLLGDCRRAFAENVIQPIRDIGYTIKNTLHGMFQDDVIIPITEADRLMSVPTAMHLPILCFEPIRKLFNNAQIFGFGYECIPDDDPYGRLIANGTCNDVLEAMDDEGDFTLTWEFSSEDPELTYEELESIEETRIFLEKFLAETTIDPTDYPNQRG